jgi:hypothetical protein
MEDFGELPEGDQGQFEGHRTFRALEAHADTSLAGRQENGAVVRWPTILCRRPTSPSILQWIISWLRVFSSALAPQCTTLAPTLEIVRSAVGY